MRRIAERNSGRQNLARPPGFQFEPRDQYHEFQFLADLVPLHRSSRRDHTEPAERRRRGIVGVAFEFRAEPKNFLPVERRICERVEAVQNPEPHRHAAAEPPRSRHIAGYLPRKSETPFFRPPEKQIRSLARHLTRISAFALRHFDRVVESQCHAQAIEARTQIRRRSRHSHPHAFHGLHNAKTPPPRKDIFPAREITALRVSAPGEGIRRGGRSGRRGRAGRYRGARGGEARGCPSFSGASRCAGACVSGCLRRAVR